MMGLISAIKPSERSFCRTLTQCQLGLKMLAAQSTWNYFLVTLSMCNPFSLSCLFSLLSVQLFNVYTCLLGVLRYGIDWYYLVNAITGKIVQSTVEECREAYASWINLVCSFSLFNTSLVQFSVYQSLTIHSRFCIFTFLSGT